jgi:DNA-binding transcriptional ArsR family regulator
MANKSISYDKGVGAEEVLKGLKMGNENSDTKKSNTKNSNSKKSNFKYSNTKKCGIHKEGVAKRKNTIHFSIVRDYLCKALGNKDSVEIKLSDMQEELGIHPNTLYKHLKTLRETEFIITRQRYGTEIKRRENV